MKISFINIVSELKNMESRIIAYKQEPKKQTLFAISLFNIDIRKIIISIFFEYEMDFSFINTLQD